VPSSGAARSGPIRVASTATGRGSDIVIRAPEEEVEEEAAAGVTPLAIQIDKIGVSAEIERVQIVDGIMQNPTGPWVVSWYEDLSAPGENNNVVMAGHVDYWDTGPAVFWGLKEPGLVEGDIIRVIGENDEVFEYEVQSSRLYNVAEELTPEVIEAEVVGETDGETLTLITCGGEFNYETSEYVSRMVLRATMV